jgi:nicotinate-nucleotide adenylyltransferase
MAHVLVAAWALAGGEVDKVWVIPTGGHPFGKELASFEHRLEMCRLAFGFSPRVLVVDAEREQRVHYTVETIRRLAAEHPDHRWRWLMGSDTVADAPQWKDFAEIERLAPPLIIPRAGHRGGVGPKMSDGEEFALPNLSSTLIREHLENGRPAAGLKGLVPAPVLGYTDWHGLYRE